VHLSKSRLLKKKKKKKEKRKRKEEEEKIVTNFSAYSKVDICIGLRA